MLLCEAVIQSALYTFTFHIECWVPKNILMELFFLLCSAKVLDGENAWNVRVQNSMSLLFFLTYIAD